MNRFSSILSVLIFIPFITVFFSCGRSGDGQQIKEYRIGVVSGGTAAINASIRSLTDQYNQKIGFQALTYVEGGDINAPVSIVQGLEKSTKDIGLGQWMSETSNKQTCGVCVPTTVTTYSMRIQFDADYFVARMNSNNPTAQDELFVLFDHEIGHGLKLTHSPNTNDVMYAVVGSNRDFATYFQKARDFFNN